MGMIHDLHLDIESRSSVDLAKGGVYKYASSKNAVLTLLNCFRMS